jgi:metal-dependent amidase/aminoacylase/carboxypeptidase family protein
VGSGEKIIALRADIDALPIARRPVCRIARKMKGDARLRP